MVVFAQRVCFCLCFLIAFVYALGWFQMASLKTILVQATQCPPSVEQTDIFSKNRSVVTATTAYNGCFCIVYSVAAALKKGYRRPYQLVPGCHFEDQESCFEE